MTPASDIAQHDAAARRTVMLMAAGLVPSLWAAWLLWLAPIGGRGADRTALAARDYTALWSAGRAAADGMVSVLSDPASFTLYMRAAFGDGIPSQIWPYPPPILLLARLCAAVPLGTGFVLYTLSSALFLLLVLRKSGITPAMRAAILCSPAVATSALTGQNGALTAAFLAGGLLLIDRRPVLSGLLLGALVIKPQFALLLPVCLLASDSWKTIFAGCISSGLLALLSLLLFGYEPWVDFLGGSHTTLSASVGAPWHSDPAQSIFTSVLVAARSAGADPASAYTAQVLVTLGCAYCAWRLWRRGDGPASRRAAATIPLALIAAPWVHTYDMPALAVAIALLVPHVTGYRRLLLGWAWIWPGLSPVITVPPLLEVLSVASVAWLATSPVLPWPRPLRWASFSPRP